jgi:hypothetical protein
VRYSGSFEKDVLTLAASHGMKPKEDETAAQLLTRLSEHRAKTSAGIEVHHGKELIRKKDGTIARVGAPAADGNWIVHFEHLREEDERALLPRSKRRSQPIAKKRNKYRLSLAEIDQQLAASN